MVRAKLWKLDNDRLGDERRNSQRGGAGLGYYRSVPRSEDRGYGSVRREFIGDVELSEFTAFRNARERFNSAAPRTV